MDLNDYNCVVMFEPEKQLRKNRHHSLHIDICRWISHDLVDLPVVLLFNLDLDNYDMRIDIRAFIETLDIYLEEYHCEILWYYILDSCTAFCIGMLPIHEL